MVDPAPGRTWLSWLGTGPVAATPAAVKGELEKLAYLRGLDADTLDLSVRYADPASLLLTPQQWEPQRLEFCHVIGKPASAADALALASDELHAALSDLETQLARGGEPGEVRLGGDGELVIPPLTAEDVLAEAGRCAPSSALLPRVPIAAVLVEIDARTGFTVVTDHPPSAGHQKLAQLVGPAQHRRPDQQHSRAAGAALHLHAARRSINHEHALIPRHEALLPGTPRTDVLKARPSGPPKLIGGRAVLLRGPMPPDIPESDVQVERARSPSF